MEFNTWLGIASALFVGTLAARLVAGAIEGRGYERRRAERQALFAAQDAKRNAGPEWGALDQVLQNGVDEFASYFEKSAEE